MRAQPPPSSISGAVEKIRAEYTERVIRHKSKSPGPATLRSRDNHYERMFAALNLLPLTHLRLLGCGCPDGDWLFTCCKRWGATDTNCVGVDLRDYGFAAFRAAHPSSRITLTCCPVHELREADESFDLIHHSMMFSSIPRGPLSDVTAQVMWRLLKPGGYIISYDFWINPLNRHAHGVRMRDLRRLFPAARIAYHRTITVAPPLARALRRLGEPLTLFLERLRLFNTYHLVALAKPLP